MDICCENITEVVENSCSSCVKKICKSYGKKILDTVDEYRDSLLHYTIATTEDFEMMKFLVKKGINVNIQNNVGATPLYYAIGRRKFVIFLLKNGADPNIGRGSFYPIINAAESSTHLEYLFGKANLNIQDENGDTPLHIYIKSEPKKSIIRKFIENGADPTIKNNNGRTAKDIYINQLLKIFEK